jgi:hypothetical protein
MLMDTKNPNFSARQLYVGASRVTSGEYLHIASPEITGWINRQVRAVPNDDRVQEDTWEEMSQAARDTALELLED